MLRTSQLRIALLAYTACLFSFASYGQLNVSTADAKKLYNIPFYSYPGKNGFEKQNIHIKDETVIMLCYLKQSVQMIVYWKSGLGFKEAEAWMKQNGTDWVEQQAPGYDNEVIHRNEEEFNFRLDPYLKQLRLWKSSKGDLAFFDSFRHELVIQSALLGTRKIEVPDGDFYLKLGQLSTDSVSNEHPNASPSSTPSPDAKK